MEEIAPPDCIFAGSVFVSRRAREFLEGTFGFSHHLYQTHCAAEKLKHSKYNTPDAIDHITRRFDETTKRLFRDRHDLQFIPFGSPLDKVRQCNLSAVYICNPFTGFCRWYPEWSAASQRVGHLR